MPESNRPSMDVLFLDLVRGIPVNGCLRLHKGVGHRPKDLVWLKSGNWSMRVRDSKDVADWNALKELFRPIAAGLTVSDVYEGGLPVGPDRRPVRLRAPDGYVDPGIRLAHVSLIRDPFAHMGYTQTVDLAWFSPDGSIRSLDGRTFGHVYLNHDTADDTWCIGGGSELPGDYLREVAGLLLDMFADLVRLDPDFPEIPD